MTIHEEKVDEKINFSISGKAGEHEFYHYNYHTVFNWFGSKYQGQLKTREEAVTLALALEEYGVTP